MDGLIYLLSPVACEDTVSLPMIKFKTLAKKIDFKLYDLLMFTSKQGVKSIEKINTDWKKLPSIAIGDATSREIESLGGEVVYKPQNFYANTLSQDIVKFFKNRKILYLRPAEVSFDSKSYLKAHNLVLNEKIIYETSCISYERNKKPLKNAIIIFTSPSSIRCFFRNFDWDKSYTAVIIGESTKKHLPENINIIVAKEALISSCVDAAKALNI